MSAEATARVRCHDEKRGFVLAPVFSSVTVVCSCSNKEAMTILLVGQRRHLAIAQGTPDPPAWVGHVHPVHAEGAQSISSRPVLPAHVALNSLVRAGSRAPMGRSSPEAHSTASCAPLTSSGSETRHPLVSSGLAIGRNRPAAATVAEQQCALGRRRILSVVPRQELDLPRTAAHSTRCGYAGCLCVGQATDPLRRSTTRT